MRFGRMPNTLVSTWKKLRWLNMWCWRKYSCSGSRRSFRLEYTATIPCFERRLTKSLSSWESITFKHWAGGYDWELAQKVQIFQQWWLWKPSRGCYPSNRRLAASALEHILQWLRDCRRPPDNLRVAKYWRHSCRTDFRPQWGHRNWEQRQWRRGCW